ncbi:A24 family peptidase [Castellaniella caeni]
MGADCLLLTASLAGSLLLLGLALGSGMVRCGQVYARRLAAGAAPDARTLWQAIRLAHRAPLRLGRDAPMAVLCGGLGAGLAIWGGAAGAALFCLCLVLLALACIDGHSGLLPDALTLPLMVAGWCLGLEARPWVAAAASALVWGGLAGLAALYCRWRGQDGLGGGDVKCLAAMSGWLGVSATLHVLWAACVLGIVCHAVRAWRRHAGWSCAAYPFGPFLAAAAVPWVVWAVCIGPWPACIGS